VCVCVAPLFQPAPSVVAISNTSLNVTWSSADSSSQLRGVARNYSLYILNNVSSWKVCSRQCTTTNSRPTRVCVIFV